MALSSFDGWSSQWGLDGGRKDRQAFCVVPIILPRADKIWGILWWLTRVDTYVWMILMCCKFNKAPPILRNEGWRCLGDVKSLIFFGDHSGRGRLGNVFGLKCLSRVLRNTLGERKWPNALPEGSWVHKGQWRCLQVVAGLEGCHYQLCPRIRSGMTCDFLIQCALKSGSTCSDYRGGLSGWAPCRELWA